MPPKDTDSIENSEDNDQTAPLEAVSTGSALFAQTNLSKNLGSLRYMQYTAFFKGCNLDEKNLI